MASSVWLGLGACAISSLLFGSVFVPVKRLDAGNGLLAQWVMATAIFNVGLVVNALQGFPQFQPLAMLGGVLWAVGNVTAIPIMNALGYGMGMLIWGTTNCFAGWAAGRFGLFGINATVPSMPVVNYAGLLLVVSGGFMFSRLRPSTMQMLEPGRSDTAGDAEDPLLEEEEEARLSSPLLVSPVPNRQTKRNLAIITALCSGVFYGWTFVPVIYIQDHPEKFPRGSTAGLDHVFAHYTGIFVTATVLFLIYIAYSGNKPVVNNRLIGPSYLAGLMWGTAQTFWFVANDNLSQAVSFPIISMVPGVCASLWSVLYFRELSGSRNLKILALAISVTMLGAIFVGVSK